MRRSHEETLRGIISEKLYLKVYKERKDEYDPPVINASDVMEEAEIMTKEIYNFPEVNENDPPETPLRQNIATNMLVDKLIDILKACKFRIVIDCNRLPETLGTLLKEEEALRKERNKLLTCFNDKLSPIYGIINKFLPELEFYETPKYIINKVHKIKKDILQLDERIFKNHSYPGGVDKNCDDFPEKTAEKRREEKWTLDLAKARKEEEEKYGFVRVIDREGVDSDEDED